MDENLNLIESVSEDFPSYFFFIFQCRGVLLVWMIVGQGPIALAVGAGGGCLDIFSLIYLFSFLLPWGWSGGAKVLGKLPVPRRPTNLDYSRARVYCACSRCGWGLF